MLKTRQRLRKRKEKSCLTLTAVYSEMTDLVDKSSVVEVIYPDSSKAFNTTVRNILTAKGSSADEIDGQRDELKTG